MSDLNQAEKSSLPSPSAKPWHRNKGLMTVAVLALVAAAVLGVYLTFSGTKKQAPQPDSSLELAPLPSVLNPQPTVLQGNIINNTNAPGVSNTTSSPNFSNAVSNIIPGAYGLFVVASYDSENNYYPTTQSIDDGIVNSGKYSGYHRIVAFRSENDPSGGGTYTFATKDYNTFILDTSSYPAWAKPANDLKDPDSIFNKAKVAGIAPIPSNFPTSIDEGNFVLERGNANWNAFISGSPQLTSNAPGLTFFAEPATLSSPNSANDAGNQSLIVTERKYVSATTNVLAEDGQGAAYDYFLVSKEESQRSNLHSPQSPNDFVFFKQNEIVSSSPLYSQYGRIFPTACGQVNVSYVLQNISQSDLVKIGTSSSGVDLYSLKDANHPLYQGEYYNKVTQVKDHFSDLNNNTPLPSLQDYLAKNPILIFQDNWGRWVALGEWQYIIGDGCGKPVIYLYPEKPTEVTVKFLNPVNFTVDIPTYAEGWDVLAHPDGQLKDLQPEKTDCSKINFSLPGSEYSQSACKAGVYPYLYWAGQTTNAYPAAQTGWVVAKADVATFLNGKLTEVGLNQKEKTDMLSYWVPELLAKDALYYRLSFFQTEQMDDFVPMQVTPKPNTTFRIFLDWSALANVPNTPLPPEVLNHLDRKGFTLVEWGGLKQ